MRWIFPSAAAVLAASAVVAGVVAFTTAGGKADCDETALASAMHEEIASAERAGELQSTIELPEGCADTHMMDAMPAVSRSWHVMPGGTMMRQPEHEIP